LPWQSVQSIATVSNQIGGSRKSTCNLLKTLGEATMEQLQFECRVCKKKTIQLVRIVTDNLPEHVKVLECTICSTMGVALVEDNAR
jgi:hypothetical protein